MFVHFHSVRLLSSVVFVHLHGIAILNSLRVMWPSNHAVWPKHAVCPRVIAGSSRACLCLCFDTEMLVPTMKWSCILCQAERSKVQAQTQLHQLFIYKRPVVKKISVCIWSGEQLSSISRYTISSKIYWWHQGYNFSMPVWAMVILLSTYLQLWLIIRTIHLLIEWIATVHYLWWRQGGGNIICHPFHRNQWDGTPAKNYPERGKGA